jgi:CheY-like chemotaxis protein
MARILVIDDDTVLRELMTEVLRDEGHDVHAAADGTEAMQLTRQEMFHLVVTDILMPGKQGIDTILELKSRFPAIKILAISGGGQGAAAGYLQAAASMGAQKTLAKPFLVEAFLEAVRELLGQE